MLLQAIIGAGLKAL
jgi:hypothetical protein